MAGKSKFLIIGGAVAAVLVLGGGAGFAVMNFWPHGHAAAKAPPPPPPKTLYFTDVANVTVSIPPDQGQPPTSFVQVGVQFSTYDPAALVSFAQLQPIIKADIINLMMAETGAALADPKTRDTLLQSCLSISNKVLAQNGTFNNAPAFSAAYITNLVVQE